ncbi:DUF3800 domain-containing protein [Paraburkholderia sabiae]|jgi:hypothetical protein|uniref:DUF3800 domain-containing protein n=1 Tax=Paraburkholderia sabiae TaxID=273251 RepID=A0ABU9QQZ3_9BURK|nr:DUF3800 domain-containing protein [Paraburkholderia sabiae]WJZ79374.1 DUF3800 domain-containing protein [Paraburkholderia sabiae]CAD6563194.1 hypothetical protein LMG24235_08436 [Paraburkholderia sabiae]
MGATIYLDESGCLGWKLDQPYGHGGSSRFFTLAAAIIPDGREPSLERVIRGMYKKRGRSARNELKSVAMKSAERIHFSNSLANIRTRDPDIVFAAITVRKERANNAFRQHPNRLYNFMTKLLLLDLMSQYDSVCFIPDARSIKVESKYALHDYLATELASVSDTALQTTPWESRDCLPLQFVDVMAGIVWSHFEHGNSDAYRVAMPHIGQRHLFF